MRTLPFQVTDEVHAQLLKAESHKRQSGIVDSTFGDCEVTTYWVGELLRVDIKLPKE